MTDNPTVEQKKSRRGLLALVGAGGAAAVAALLGRRNKTQAAPLDAFLLGLINDSWTAGSELRSNSSDHTLKVVNGHTGDAVWGEATGADGFGVRGIGDGTYGIGVYGNGKWNGVEGASLSGVGVWGYGPGDIGVVGYGKMGVKGIGKPGVYGYCRQDNGSGVKGEGDAPNTIGLYGLNKPGRRALRTKGRVQMDSIHKKKSLSNKSNLIALPSAINAGAEAVVIATMQGDPGNDAVIQRAYRVDTRHIRIQFNKAPANPVSVAYWVAHPD